jgi:multidrug efflux system membrane fusion protein
MNKAFLLSCLILASCSKTSPMPPPHQVSATKPLIKDVDLYVDYIGHMTAKISVAVKTQVSGELMAQYFIEGQKVKKGDLLLVIDPRPYQASLEQAKGALQQTEATLNYNKETTTRNTPLVKQEYISQLNYDQYVTNVLVSEAEMIQHKAQVETAQINLGYCFIEAPMDSVTGQLVVKPGNYVDSNAGTVLTTLNQIQPILVDFYIPETDLFTIQEKQAKGSLKLYVYPEPSHKRVFEGDLTLIDNQVNTSTGAILLEGTLKNEESLLWPGHYVDVRLILDEVKDAILIPSNAVLIGNNGQYVFVVKEDSTIETKLVKVGQRYDDKWISIESGLEASDVVVTEGQLNLYPGMTVSIQSEGSAQ